MRGERSRSWLHDPKVDVILQLVSQVDLIAAGDAG